MRWREPEPFGLDREACITQRRSGLTFQTDQILWQTLIRSNPHQLHLRDKVAVRKEKFGSENLRSDFQTLVQIRLVAVRNPEIPIAEEMFQLVRHCENHRILRQTFRDHDRGAEMIVNKCTTQVSEPIRPFVEHDVVLRIDPHEIARENAR